MDCLAIGSRFIFHERTAGLTFRRNYKPAVTGKCFNKKKRRKLCVSTGAILYEFWIIKKFLFIIRMKTLPQN